MSEILPISPSRLQMVAVCPGSVRMELEAHNADKTVGEASDAAKRGTLLHELARKKNDRYTDDPRFTALPDEDKDALLLALDRMENVRDEFSKAHAPFLEMLEEKVDVSFLGMEATGRENEHQIDVALLSEDGSEHIIMDYKFGKGYVTAPGWNWQMKAYACAFARQYGGEKITACIIQPAAGEPLRNHTFTEDQLAAAEKDIVEIVNRAKMEDAPLVPDPDACMFCAAKNMCPARATTLITTPTHFALSEVMRGLEPEAKRDYVKKLVILGSYIKDKLTEIEAAVKAGTLTIPEAEMRFTRTNREWKDERLVRAELRSLCARHGVNQAMLETEPKLISPAQAQKVFGKKVYDGNIERMVEKIPSGEKLVLDADKEA